MIKKLIYTDYILFLNGIKKLKDIIKNDNEIKDLLKTIVITYKEPYVVNDAEAQSNNLCNL